MAKFCWGFKDVNAKRNRASVVWLHFPHTFHSQLIFDCLVKRSVGFYRLFVKFVESSISHYSPHEIIAPHFDVITMIVGFKLSEY